jgi:hypothetical protein
MKISSLFGWQKAKAWRGQFVYIFMPPGLVTNPKSSHGGSFKERNGQKYSLRLRFKSIKYLSLDNCQIFGFRNF